MNCPSCKQYLESQSPFCPSCGHRLSRNCSSCSFENSLFVNFCGQCGQRLITEDTILKAKKELSTLESRQVTVIFIDLIGSTTLSDSLEPEDYKNLIEKYQQICSARIKQYNGFVYQYLGDGVLALFGYPRATENDGIKAIRSCLEIIEDIQQRNIEGRKNDQINIRIGIHTGQVIAGEISGTEQIIGQTTNLAARIQGESEPNSILVSQSTYELTKQYFDFQSKGTHSLKGISDQVHLYEVVSWKGIEQRLKVTNEKSLSPFVGRTRELDFIIGTIRELQEKVGQVIVLNGEAGIGKSRLLSEITNRVQDIQNLLVNVIECSSYNLHSPFFPLVEWFKSRISKGSNAETIGYGKLIDRFLVENDMFSDLNRIIFFDFLSTPLPKGFQRPQIAPNALRQQTLQCFVDVFTNRINETSELLIIEDLHWMDDSTHEWLEFLIDHIQGSGIILLISTRPLNTPPPWFKKSGVSMINLSSLNHEDIEVITRAKSKNKPLPVNLVKEIFERTDGNPLFAEEVTLSLIDTNQLLETDDSFEPRDLNIIINVPSTLQDALMSRLDNIPQSKRLVQISSVLGREFEYELIRKLATDDEHSLSESLNNLVSNEILYKRSHGKNSTYIFKHALIQDTAYDSIVKSKKAEIHGNIAEVYIKYFPQVVESQPERIAQHLVKAGSIQESLLYWLKAGQIESLNHANEEAIYHLNKGLFFIDHLKKEGVQSELEVDFLVTLGGAEIVHSGYTHPNVEMVFTRAQALSLKSEHDIKIAYVIYGLSVYYLLRNENVSCSDLAEHSILIGEKEGLYEYKLFGYHIRGVLHVLKGNFIQAREALERTLELYDPDYNMPLELTPGGDVKVNASVWLSLALHRLGYINEAFSISQGVAEWGKHFDEARTIYHINAWKGWLYLQNREWESCLGSMNVYIPIAEKFGDPFFLLFANIQLNASTAFLGDSDSVDRFNDLITAAIDSGTTFFYVIIDYLAEIYLMNNVIDRGYQLCVETIARCTEIGNLFCIAEVYRIKGEYMKRLGKSFDEVERCFMNSIDISKDQKARVFELRAARSLAQLYSENERIQDAISILEEPYIWFKDEVPCPDIENARIDLARLQQMIQ